MKYLSIVLIAGLLAYSSYGAGNNQIKVGDSPNFVLATPDGKYAVVSNFGSENLSLVDLQKNREVLRVDAGYGPLGMCFSIDGKLIYVTNMETGLVKAFSLPRLDLIETFKVGHIPTDIVATPDGYYLAVANFGKGKQGRVDYIDFQKQRIVKSFEVGVRPLALAATSQGNRIYVANSAQNTVSVIEFDQKTTVATYTVGEGPDGLALSRNGRKLFIAHSRSNDLWVFDTRREKVLQKVALPGGPFRIAIAPDESSIAVTCNRENVVAWMDFDIGEKTVVKKLNTKKMPVGICYSIDGKRLLVACEEDNVLMNIVLPVPSVK